MNQDRMRGICRQLSGKLKQLWGTFANDPRTAAAGAYDQLAGRCEERRSTSQVQSDRQLEDFISRHRHWQDLSVPAGG